MSVRRPWPAALRLVLFATAVRAAAGEVVCASAASMDGLMAAWTRDFTAAPPDTPARVAARTQFSAEAFDALLRGEVQVAPFARELFPDERARYAAKFPGAARYRDFREMFDRDEARLRDCLKRVNHPGVHLFAVGGLQPSFFNLSKSKLIEDSFINRGQRFIFSCNRINQVNFSRLRHGNFLSYKFFTCNCNVQIIMNSIS